MITYELDDYSQSDKIVKVTFKNDEGLVHERRINIPHLEDGSIDEDYLEEILNNQLMGVQSKLKVGVIKFTEPITLDNQSELSPLDDQEV